MLLPSFLFSLGLLPTLIDAHAVPWVKGMYCLNGTTPGVNDQNTNAAVDPMFNLTKSDWWFHHYNKCDEFPPSPGDFLEMPAGGSFTVEIAENRAFTTLSYGGVKVTAWGDGRNHPVDYSIINLDGTSISDSGCLSTPNLHAQNRSMAAGSAFAISYTSNLHEVTPENLAVFTVRYHTPFERLTTYDVPADLPKCPEGGCICGWGWVPDGCGLANMYMMPYRCNVTNPGHGVVTPAKPAVWCEGAPGNCTSGAKQMIFWHQLDGNNIETPGIQANGHPKSPGYNMKLGFQDGAQKDIFVDTPVAPPEKSTTTTPIVSSTRISSSAASSSSLSSPDVLPTVPPPVKSHTTSTRAHATTQVTRTSSKTPIITSKTVETSEKPSTTSAHSTATRATPSVCSHKHHHHKAHHGHHGHHWGPHRYGQGEHRDDKSQ